MQIIFYLLQSQKNDYKHQVRELWMDQQYVFEVNEQKSSPYYF